MKKFGLTSNRLKILAAVFMVCDHVGFFLVSSMTPTVAYYVLRCIGRLAFPIFAYLIAEGCTHSKHRLKYLLTMAAFAVGAEIVYTIVNGTGFASVPYMSVFMMFAAGILLCYIYDGFRENLNDGKLMQSLAYYVLLVVLLGILYYVDIGVKEFEYRFFGVLMILMCYVFKSKPIKLLMLAICSILIALSGVAVSFQICSLFSIPFIALYNGIRGKWRMKYFFYLFYPGHIVIILGVGAMFGII